jgi:hypothetical protein
VNLEDNSEFIKEIDFLRKEIAISIFSLCKGNEFCDECLPKKRRRRYVIALHIIFLTIIGKV